MMKKLMTLLLVVVLLLGTAALAESFDDVTSLTDAELEKLYTRCVGELAVRNNDAGNIWYQNEDKTITIQMTGIHATKENSLQFVVYYQILNASDKSVTFSMRNIAINGWKVRDVTHITTASPARNAGDYAMLYDLKSRVGWLSPKEACESVTRMEFNLHVSIGGEEIIVPIVITDFSEIAMGWR